MNLGKPIIYSKTLLITSAMLSCLAFCACSYFSSTNGTQSKEDEKTQQVILASPELQRLDNVCRKFGLPVHFELIRKSADDRKGEVTSYFHSPVEFESVKGQMLESFRLADLKTGTNDNGAEKIIYGNKGDYQIILKHGRLDDKANYSLSCVRSQ